MVFACVVAFIVYGAFIVAFIAFLVAFIAFGVTVVCLLHFALYYLKVCNLRLA